MIGHMAIPRPVGVHWGTAIVATVAIAIVVMERERDVEGIEEA